MSIGIVMFFKALILGIAGALWDWWLDYKKKHAANGLPMLESKDGVFRAYSWPEVWERRARITFWAAFALVNVFALAVVWPWIWPSLKATLAG